MKNYNNILKQIALMSTLTLACFIVIALNSSWKPEIGLGQISAPSGTSHVVIHILDKISLVNMFFLPTIIIIFSYISLRAISTTEKKMNDFLLETATMLVVITALLIPKADMLVVDRVSGKKEIVSGLPYAFVLPVSIVDKFVSNY